MGDDIVFSGDIHNQIRATVSRLIDRSAFTSQDREDLEQELRLHLLRRLPHYDSERGPWHAFVWTVLNHRAASLIRDRWCLKRDDRQRQPLGEIPHNPVDEQQDLAIDMAALLQQVPKPLRKLAEQLQIDTPSAAAQVLGISRTTAYARLRKLRERCADAGLEIYLKNHLKKSA